jgi:hypothetical protein
MAAFIVPPPRRRASPAQEQIGGVCSLRFTSLRSGRKPVLPRLKGGGAAPGRSRGPSGRKKRKRPCLRFFSFRAASCRPRRRTATAGRSMPVRLFVFPSRTVQSAPRLRQVIPPPRNSVMKVLSPITARPLKRTGSNLPGEKIIYKPIHTTALSRSNKD